MKKKRDQLLPWLMLLGLLLGVHKGKLALWKDQDPIPVKVLPYPVELLPVPFQQALEKGIPIESAEDLEELLKKYLP